MPHGIGLLVNDHLQLLIELLALGEQFVELDLAQHAAQRRLRNLRRRLQIIFDLGDRRFGRDYPEEDNRVHVHGDVVTSDHFLRGHVERHGPQVHFDHLIDDGDDEEEPRPFGPLEPSEPKDHDSLILAHDLDRVEQEEHDDGQHDDERRCRHSETSYDVEQSIPSQGGDEEGEEKPHNPDYLRPPLARSLLH
jgi:hypothetical protein